MPAAVEVKGLRELTSSLKTFEKDVAKAPQRINKEAAVLVAQAARGTAPRRSGRLAASNRPGAYGVSAYVKSSLIYSPVIHFGWPHHHIRPQPWLYEALDQRREAIVALYEVRVTQLAEKVRGI